MKIPLTILIVGTLSVFVSLTGCTSSPNNDLPIRVPFPTVNSSVSPSVAPIPVFSRPADSYNRGGDMVKDLRKAGIECNGYTPDPPAGTVQINDMDVPVPGSAPAARERGSCSIKGKKVVLGQFHDEAGVRDDIKWLRSQLDPDDSLVVVKGKYWTINCNEDKTVCATISNKFGGKLVTTTS